jgi:hypothetical protein
MNFDYYIMMARLHEHVGFPGIQWIAPVDPHQSGLEVPYAQMTPLS